MRAGRLFPNLEICALQPASWGIRQRGTGRQCPFKLVYVCLYQGLGPCQRRELGRGLSQGALFSECVLSTKHLGFSKGAEYPAVEPTIHISVGKEQFP